MDAAHHTTQLSFSLSLPLPASSQSAETPCVSAKQWSIPSVYFTYFCCSSCRLSLSLIPLFLFSPLCFSYFMLYSISFKHFFGQGQCRGRPLEQGKVHSLQFKVYGDGRSVPIRTSEGCGRFQEKYRVCVFTPLSPLKNIEKRLFRTITDLGVMVLKS